jgi:hypothetical protein
MKKGKKKLEDRTHLDTRENQIKKDTNKRQRKTT